MCIRDSIVDVEASSEQGDDPAAPRVHRQSFNHRHHKGAAVSGHSKWATTKHKKAVVDARRGKLFAKLIKTIEMSARAGGGDPAGNPTLADAIAKAKSNSVPNDNIERAVKRGSGELGDGANYEAITYEGYGPGGVAVLVECLTDNRNRAASEVRTAMTRNGGTMADPSSVAYLFNRRGVALVAGDGRARKALRAAFLSWCLIHFSSPRSRRGPKCIRGRRRPMGRPGWGGYLFQPPRGAPGGGEGLTEDDVLGAVLE